ncbi:hypothetical protein [Elizabethkingia meningoseptica]|uniref:hypothetical protein n=1 Tax=Elizabethkingia meningoseptica TaxID=238 RepID=UPI0038914803
MKRIIFNQLVMAVFFLPFTIVYGQKISIKKQILLIDNKEVFKAESTGQFGANGYIFYDLHNETPVLKIIANNGGTHMYLGDDFLETTLLATGQRFDIKGRVYKDVLLLLLKNKVLTPDGTIDDSKVELFLKNYDEKIRDRTLMVR